MKATKAPRHERIKSKIKNQNVKLQSKIQKDVERRAKRTLIFS